jgi:antitoxin HicB
MVFQLIHEIDQIIEVIKMAECLISIKMEKLEEGGYLATSDTLQGLIAQGRTIAETMEIAQEVARKLIESYIEHGDPLPVELEPSRKVIHNLKIPITVTV